MRDRREPAMVVTGVGVTTALGQGREAFAEGLFAGRDCFGVMARPGRQAPPGAAEPTAFLGAEIGEPRLRDLRGRDGPVDERLLRGASLSARVALATLAEAWHDARLDDVAAERIGLVVGGTNLQQRELVELQESYRDRLQFLRPTYGLTFLDTDLCGLLSEVFGIRGFAYTVGGASASGQLAVIRALEAVAADEVDVAIALGALQDLSYWECQGLRSLGAMGSDRHARQPGRACRPFDRQRDGFIYGEACGAVVVERLRPTGRPGVEPYGRLLGWAFATDGHRLPDPSADGEAGVIKKTLWRARWTADDVDYVNPHGTGSPLGDETELAALERCGLGHVAINATKSIVGHGLSAAGAVELIAVLLQIGAGRLHPTRNLDDPMDDRLAWVRSEPVGHRIDRALNLSFGFGGVNTALAVGRY